MTGLRLRGTLRAAALLFIVVWISFPNCALGQEPKIDTGDTAWVLTSTALVLFMTIPGLSPLTPAMKLPSKIPSINLDFTNDPKSRKHIKDTSWFVAYGLTIWGAGNDRPSQGGSGGIGVKCRSA